MQLSFNEATHCYELDGRVVPSVTQIIKPLVDFSMVPVDTLERARAYGVAVHKAVELEIAGTLDYSTLDEGLFPPLEAFSNWKTDYPDIANMLCGAVVEKTMASKLGYAGRPDIIIDGFCVIDLKTRAPNPLTDPIQCAAYEALHKANGGAAGKYEHRVLQLKTDGTYMFKKVNDKDAWGRFRLLLDTYNNLKTIESWKK